MSTTNDERLKLNIKYTQKLEHLIDVCSDVNNDNFMVKHRVLVSSLKELLSDKKFIAYAISNSLLIDSLLSREIKQQYLTLDNSGKYIIKKNTAPDVIIDNLINFIKKKLGEPFNYTFVNAYDTIPEIDNVKDFNKLCKQIKLLFSDKTTDQLLYELTELNSFCSSVKDYTGYKELEKMLNKLLTDAFFKEAIKYAGYHDFKKNEPVGSVFLDTNSDLYKYMVQEIIKFLQTQNENKVLTGEEIENLKENNYEIFDPYFYKKYYSKYQKIKKNSIQFIADYLKEARQQPPKDKDKGQGLQPPKGKDKDKGQGLQPFKDYIKYDDTTDTIKFNYDDNKPKLTDVAIKALCNKMKQLFGVYKKDEGSDSEILTDRTGELFYKIDEPKSTYTFNIKPNEIDIVHHLLGDLFMLRSEIPHDFKDSYLNMDLYKKIIELSICDYMYTNTNYNDDTLKILEDILKISLTEALAGNAVLELLLKSNVPVVQQSEGKLKIVVDNNPSSGILPRIFGRAHVTISSDSDHAGDNIFSQLPNDSVTMISTKTCPFNAFDAGNSWPAQQFKPTAERTQYLKEASGVKGDEVIPPPEKINVTDLDKKQYLSINSNPHQDGSYEYSLEFNNPDNNVEFSHIVNLLNTGPIKLIHKNISNASITIVASVVNEVLKRLYLSTKGLQQHNDANLPNFLEEQVVLYKNYVNEISKGRYYNNFESVQSSDTSSKSKAKSKKPISSDPISSDPISSKATSSDNKEKAWFKARFICKILLNTISVKSLGDLVPYYLSLIQIMEKKPKPTNTLNFTDDELQKYFTTRKSTDDHFIGIVNSGDYSMIQLALVNLVFLHNNGSIDSITQQNVDNTELYACVHVFQNDVIPPCSLKAKNITRLMACIANSNPDVLKYFAYTKPNPFTGEVVQRNVVEDLQQYSSTVNFMNIKEKIKDVHDLFTQIYSFAKRYKIQIEETMDVNINIINQCQKLKTILETTLGQYTFDTDDVELISSYILELQKINLNFNIFIKNIKNLNDKIKQIGIDEIKIKHFFDELINYDQKKGSTSNVSLTVQNENVYFLCEYIIRNLNHSSEQANSKQITTSKMETDDELTSVQVIVPETISNNESESRSDMEEDVEEEKSKKRKSSEKEGSNTTTDNQRQVHMEEELFDIGTKQGQEIKRAKIKIDGGNIQKSSKFKVTKKYKKPKKQKKRTRKYVKK
jgi:hypothetical protein